MGIIKNLFKKNTEIKPVKDVRKDTVYMEEGSSIACQDKENGTTKTVYILPKHVNHSLDVPIEFPRFDIVKVTSMDGMYGMHLKNVLTLDADEMPTEFSNNLITSGTLFNIISSLQRQINELKDIIQK